MAKRKPFTDKTVTYNPKAHNCDVRHIYEMTIRALKRQGHADKVAEYQKLATSGDYRHLLAVTRRYVHLVRV